MDPSDMMAALGAASPPPFKPALYAAGAGALLGLLLADAPFKWAFIAGGLTYAGTAIASVSFFTGSAMSLLAAQQAGCDVGAIGRVARQWETNQ